MESVERKDASTGPEEPIKTEGVVPSPDTSERSNAAASPPPNCSICLGKLINTSFTDSCLHQFCFTCLLQWSKIKTECPLCKQTFKSIIHNVRSEEDYDQYHVQYTSQVAATLDVTADIHISGQWDVAVGVGVPVRPFMYRTTMGSNRRYGMLLNPEAVARRVQIPSIAPQISIEERRRRNENPIDYRRTVYRHGVWAASLPDALGRFRESSAEYYRRHPTEVNRLIPWLNRELQVLLNNNQSHIAYVITIITDTVTQYDIHSAEFRNLVRPYFGIHTDHFVHEFSNYARTNFDLVGYDQAVTYIPHRALSNEYVTRAISPTLSTSSSSSNDSDVRVLNDSFDRFNYLNAPSVGPHIIDMPGPSTVGQAFRIQLPYIAPDVLTISSTSSSSENECEVVGYVKPRHERTPEIIDLSSSDAEVITTSQSASNDNTQSEVLIPPKEENLPSTSSSGDNIYRRTRRRTDDMVKAKMYEYLDTTSESDGEESDSDYNPRRHKSTSKKGSKTVLRKLRTRKRKKSVGAQRKRDKGARNRSPYFSCQSDNDSPQREASNSRGLKRYLSKSSEDSDFEKPTKKNKKGKKSKSSKKVKKRRVASTPASKIPPRNYSSSSSSSSSSDSEDENNKNDRRRSKKRWSKNFFRYPSEENSVNDKSSSKSSSTKGTSQRTESVILADSDLSDYRKRLYRRSSTESFNSPKNHERLQDVEGSASRHCTSDENDEDAVRLRNSSAFSDNTPSTYPKRKSSSSKITNAQSSTRQSSDRLSTTTTSSTSLKSDASSPAEHSVSSKVNRDRHRSHKKRKESKTRRRSRS